MHYCQRCDVAVIMEPSAQLAVCPACGSSERAVRLPLFVVTGASGSGKTTIFPHLVEALPECVIFDVDWLIDAFESAGETETVSWPAFREAWLSVAHGVAQGGRHTVLLGPFMPEQLAPLATRRWVTDIHFAVLDCADDVRRARLTDRPLWRERAVDKHIAFAAHLRRTIPIHVATDATPAEAADLLARWVRTTLRQGGVALT